MIRFYIENSNLLRFMESFKDTEYRERIEKYDWEQVAIPLHVTQAGAFNVTPDVNITVTDLNKGDTNFIYKRFYNQGYGGISFKIEVILKKGEKWTSKYYKKYMGKDTDTFTIISVLREIIESMTPVKVVTDAMDIPNGNYIITKNSTRKQSSEGYTVWDLEFTSYTPLVEVVYSNDNTMVKNAISKAKAKQSNVTVASKTSSSKGKSSKVSKLSKCNRSVLVYSRKQKKVTCVVYLQEILKKLKCYSGKVDGWFGPLTTTGVKNFQRKYKKKYSLKITGTVNQKTYNAIISVSSGDTIKNTSKKITSTSKVGKK